MQRNMKKHLKCTPKPLRKIRPTLHSSQTVIPFADKFLLIGAAVLLALDRVSEALVDCDKAIELNPDFIKVNIYS